MNKLEELKRIINKYKRGTWDEEYTVQAIQQLIDKEVLEARIEELKWANTRSPAGKLSDLDFNERILALQTNNKESE